MHLLHYEEIAWSSGKLHLAGVDEAGRGPLAGPVVVSAVQLSSETAHELLQQECINDSKKLSRKRRDAAYTLLMALPGLHVGTAIISPQRVDEINILQATHEGFRGALKQLKPLPDWAFIDGRPIPNLPCPNENIIKGDSKSLLIGAASIIAKVTRDHLMEEADKKWPEYGFAKHMGYGTKQHLQALSDHGACPIHRKTFRPVSEVIAP